MGEKRGSLPVPPPVMRATMPLTEKRSSTLLGGAGLGTGASMLASARIQKEMLCYCGCKTKLRRELAQIWMG